MEPAQRGQKGPPGGSWTKRWLREGQRNWVKEREGVSGKGHSMCEDLQMRNRGQGGAAVRAEAGEVHKGPIINAKQRNLVLTLRAMGT